VHSSGSYRELQEAGLDVTTFLNSRTYKNVDVCRLSDMTSPLIQDLATSASSVILTGTPPQTPMGLKDSPSGSYEMFHHHDIKVRNPSVELCSEFQVSSFKRKVKESIEIKTRRLNYNRRGGY
jgi:hypothetical protein